MIQLALFFSFSQYIFRRHILKKNIARNVLALGSTMPLVFTTVGPLNFSLPASWLHICVASVFHNKEAYQICQLEWI